MRLTLQFFGCWLLLSIVAVGQVGTQSSITGTVTDASGAGVAGAQVTATNISTNESKQVVTGQSGDFNILALPAGIYRIIAQANGFKKWENSQLTLTVGDQIRVSPVLQVGAITEVVVVSATNDVIQTENSAVETVVQMQQIRELPLDQRNPIALVGLTPGMQYEADAYDSGMRISYVQGQGLRDNKTNFQLDGVTSNDGMSEGGIGVPNADAVAEFTVQSLNAGAWAGRNPSQVVIVTKAGTNEFHGDAFEFIQNDAFNAYYAYADKTKPKPHVRYNQFGGTLGGPIIKNKTFFFGSFQGTNIKHAVTINENAVPVAFESGDFSSLGHPIIDPTTGLPFPGNIIPANRVDPASQYFLPLFVTSPSAPPNNLYNANATLPDKTWEYLGRIDHQLTNTQRIYGRYQYLREPQLYAGYTANPSTFAPNTVVQHGLSVNYNWAISSNTLFTATAGLVKNRDSYSNPLLGKQNDSQLAGIQGIPTTGRQAWIGPPDIFINGYTGVSFAGGWGVPGALWTSQYTGKASLNHDHGAHSFNVGLDYGDRHAFGGHGSAAARGRFFFFNNYTGDGFADYLLGYPNYSDLNDPLTTFGEDRAPYIAPYASDTWKAKRNLTLDVGVRYERYLSQHCYKNLCSLWDPKDGKTAVAVDSHGNPNFSTFPTTAALAAQTAGLWETSTQAGYPRGLYEPNGHWSPRLGVTYRPFSNRDLVVRAGFGTYYNIFTGNRGASEVNVPTWTVFSHSYAPSQLQNWRTVWSTAGAASGFAVYSPLVDIKPAKTEEWNVSIQTSLPTKTSLTVGYVGTRVPNEISGMERNLAPPGYYPSGPQSAEPYPAFSTIHTYQNMGKFWYHSLQTHIEHRFSKGLSFTFAHAFSREMDSGVGEGNPGTSSGGEFDAPLPFSPAWYNRHRSINDYRHVESATLLWELPYGHGRRFGSNTSKSLDVLLGGWQVSFVQTARSGQPLTISQSDGNLGNFTSSRANLVGDPHISNPSKNEWFNTAAFAPAPSYSATTIGAFGDSGVGVVDGPGRFQLNSMLAKNFYVTERKYFQFRWEAYNVLNRVNYDNPDQNVSDSSGFGKIFSAGSARYMQFGLKFLF
jgi:hypothetical protein